MAEFSSSGEFGHVSKPNEIVGDKQGFGCQALPNEVIAPEFRMDVENNMMSKENRAGEVELFRDDPSVDHVVDKSVQMCNAVSDGVALEGGDASLNIEPVLVNEGGDVYVTVQSERPGDGILAEAMDASLNLEHVSEIKGGGNHESLQGEQPKDGVHSEAMDISLNLELVSENKGKGTHESLQGEQPGDGISSEAVDSSLNFKCASDNQGGVTCESVQGEQLGDHISLEGVDVSLNCESVLGNEGEGANGSVQIEQPGEVIPLEGMDISLVFEPTSANEGEGAHVSVQGEEPDWEENADLEGGHDNVKVERNVETKDAIQSHRLEDAQISLDGRLHSDVTKNCGKIEDNECNACEIQVSPIALSMPPVEETGEKVRVVVLASPCSGEVSKRGRKPKNPEAISTMPKKAEAISAKRNLRQSLVENTRPLRSRSRENSKVPQPSVDAEAAKGNTSRRGRRKNKEKDGKSDDVYSRMRRHLKYQLHRIHYEQNLLEAYSSEGWRGQSLEKLRPEKELQRAKDDINRSKFKIRDLFQRLNSMSAEGKFPDTLYDSEGLIDSEDIFCAKCGSKDLPIGNDIILCDGICERGFHQYCLDPPLRTEEIPPGDEGWLCPACDCKLDCIELVNDSQGTKLKIEDSWEKVFPEAIAATTGKELDDVMGLPSDDSEDNEYNPDGIDDNDDDNDPNVEGSNSSSGDPDSDESDSSDFSSASEDLGAICGTEQNLGLPSDDSEDDDYDPDAKNVDDEEIANESSGSDFTSASEDLNAAIGDDDTLDKDEPPLTSEQEQDLGESVPITSKRCVEKLDYKKLYDETYGNADSDSSDDEEWTDMVATRKRKNSTEKAAPVSSLAASVSSDGACGSGISRRRGQPKANPQVANGSPAQLQGSSEKTSSGGSRSKRKPYNKLGEAVTQRLYESFKENHYPDRETKEKLADELGLTAYRVDKWFGNARWSLNHHPSRVEASMSRVVSHNNTPIKAACNGDENASASDVAGLEHGSADGTKLDATIEQTSKKSRNNNTEGLQSMMENAKTENSKADIQTDPHQTPEAPLGRAQRKRRKSGL